VHEGHATFVSRADGTQSEQGFVRVGGDMSVHDDEFAGLPIAEVMRRLRDLATEMASGRAAHVVATLDAACQEVGNVVDAEGAPIGPELLLRMWETIDIDFDDAGRPRMPSIHVGTAEQADAVREAQARIAADPKLRARAEEIMQRKRDAWLAREADRTLAG
jgi:hypothetical protein